MDKVPGKGITGVLWVVLAAAVFLPPLHHMANEDLTAKELETLRIQEGLFAGSAIFAGAAIATEHKNLWPLALAVGLSGFIILVYEGKANGFVY